MINATAVFNSYILTALWSETDNDDKPLDMNYSRQDIDPDDLVTLRNTVDLFLARAEAVLDSIPLVNPVTVGHNLWLNQNGHGAGFWDTPELWGGEENAQRLSDLAKELGERYIYVGDDENIYVG